MVARGAGAGREGVGGLGDAGSWVWNERVVGMQDAAQGTQSQTSS